MLRSGAPRSLLRSLNATSRTSSSIVKSPLSQQLRSRVCTISHRPTLIAATRPLVPQIVTLARWHADKRGPVNTIDTKHEDEIKLDKLMPSPETVSSLSSTVPLGGQGEMSPAPLPEEDEPNMMGGITSDLKTIRETFSLAEVPRQAYYMGMAGVLPYMATSLSTVVCAWEINHAAENGTGFLMSDKTAEAMLHIIEPIQVGYGAVILSFLGAIHWGLEWAKYGGEKGYPRYLIGVGSTAVAWPTILLPVEYALITQFLAFTFLYYTDVRAKTRGWAPPWYGIYRFVLTFIVGASIVASLIGRGQIADKIGRAPTTADRIAKFKSYNDDDEDQDEMEMRRKFLPNEGEDEEDEDEEEEDEEDDE